MTSGVTENRGEIAIKSILNLAYDFIDKPISFYKLRDTLDSLYEKKATRFKGYEGTIKLLKENGFITNSYQISKQFSNALKTFNEMDISILITGETGTGKTLFARVLHSVSKYSDKSFYEFHCRSLPNDINSAKSQLFGHIKGAFTGAIENKKGILDISHTILFDDIHHLHPEIQPFLLQLLESGTYTRLGNDVTKIHFKGKIIASSIYSVEELRNKNLLSKELLYRIAGDVISIPPLRVRKEDISEIIQYQLKKLEKTDFIFDNILIQYLKEQRWEGNTRELISFVKRVAMHSDKKIFTLNDYQHEIQEQKERLKKIANYVNLEVASQGLEELILTIRKQVITNQLKIHKGNISKTALALGYKNHRSLIYWLQKLNIDVNEYKP